MITGGMGFIGSHICRELLKNGEEVIAFDNIDNEKINLLKNLRIPDIHEKVKIISGDINNLHFLLQTIKNNGVDKIIHTAAITFIPTAVKNPGLTFKVNVEGTFNVLEAARQLNVNKTVYISTSSVYGDFQKSEVNESQSLEPKDIYGGTKLAADRLAISYYRTYGIDTTIVRTTSVYGPGDLENRAAKMFVENALTGKEMCLEGGGLQKRDFSYIKDVANGICLATLSDKTKGEVFHIANGKSYTIRDLADVIKKFIPNAKITETPKRNVDVNRGCLNIDKAKKILGFEPKFDLENGIKDYIKWYVNVYTPIFGLKIVNNQVI